MAATTEFVYVSIDIAFVPGGVTESVIGQLNTMFSGNSPYGFQNVMLSATHTHSGPGGYSTETLYDLTSFGFVQKNYDTIVNGIAQAIFLAHQSRRTATLQYNIGELLNTNINRSPYSYPFNKDADLYQYDVDKNMTVIRIQDASGNPFGMIAIFSVHGTSLNNTNELISGDNKGFASWFIERSMSPSAFPGQNSFVAAFGQSNEGDVSPNTAGPLCQNDGSQCDAWHSTCNDDSTHWCYAFGPGENGDMYQSCQEIGLNQAQFALKQWNSTMAAVAGPVGYRHQFVDFSRVTVDPVFSSTQKQTSTCVGALGDSFAAGTTDGAGDFFIQGMNWTATSGKWYILNSLAHVLSEPSLEQRKCQHPKPILFNVGDIRYPGDQPWSSTIIPLQMFRVGQLVFIGVPGEFTTMSGRRLRQQVEATFAANGQVVHAMIAGLANDYTHYIATPEEYTVQRYEAASTLFGPETLPAYLQTFTDFASSLATNSTLPDGLGAPEYGFTGKLFPDWQKDAHPEGSPFGTVLQDVQPMYTPGELVSVTFQGANPDNNYMTNSSYFYVQALSFNQQWVNVLSDADFETVFRWRQPSKLEYISEVTIQWLTTSSSPPGSYRIQYFGTAKNEGGSYTTFQGLSSVFSFGENRRDAVAPASLEEWRAASLVGLRDYPIQMP